jgi:hypothetical protein
MSARGGLPESDENKVIFHCHNSPIALLGIGLLFTAIGIGGLIVSLRHVTLFGLAFSVFWLTGLLWYLLNYAYDVALMANGDIRFRLFWGHRVINASNVRSIGVRRAEGSWLVVRARGPRIHMSNSSCHHQLVRLIGGMNPTADLPPEIPPGG